MSIKWLVVYALAGMIGGALWTSTLAAQPGCKLYKVSAQTLYVSKDAKMSAEYIGVLERDSIACVSLEKKVGNRQWGYVSHKQIKGGGSEPINGWVGLRFMKLQSQAGALTPVSKPGAAKPPAPAPALKVASKVITPRGVTPEVVMPKIANTPPAPPAAPPLTATAQAEIAAENAYRATAAIGSCGAYKLFEEKYRNTFYGRLAAQHLQASCANKNPQIQAGNPGTGAPVAVASVGTAPATGVGAAPALSAGELTMAIQQELNRLGCSPGRADGNWGRRSRNAMRSFNRVTKLKLDTGKPTGTALATLRASGGIVCSAPAVTKVKKPARKAPVKKKAKTAKKKKKSIDETTRVECERTITAQCF